MVALVLETVTERGIIALVKQKSCLFFAGLPFGFHNAKFLLPKLQEAFHESKINPKDLEIIVTGIGPGSYTGIRVGAAVAKTLSYTCKIPLVGIGTLEGFLPDKNCSFCAILDAKLSGFYVLKGVQSDNEITYLCEPTICSLDNLGSFLNGIEILVTPYVKELETKVRALYPHHPWKWQETAPNPISLAQKGHVKVINGNYSINGHLNFLYLK